MPWANSEPRADWVGASMAAPVQRINTHRTTLENTYFSVLGVISAEWERFTDTQAVRFVDTTFGGPVVLAEDRELLSAEAAMAQDTAGRSALMGCPPSVPAVPPRSRTTSSRYGRPSQTVNRSRRISS